jgi:WD40 repeat protein
MKKLFSMFFVFVTAISYGQDVELSVQTGHSAAIEHVVFSPDDLLIATSGLDNKIVLWDFFTSKQFDVLLGHNSHITGICFSADGKTLYSASADSTVKTWDIETGLCVETMKFNAPLGGIGLSPDGKTLVALSRELTFINFETNQKSTVEFKAAKLFTCIAFSENGERIAFGGDHEDFAYIVDVKNNSLIKKVFSPLQDVKFDGNDIIIFSTSEGILAEINLSTKKRKSATTDWMLNAMNAFDFNNDIVYAANNKGEIRLYNRNKKWKNFGLFKQEKSKINSLTLSHNGRFMATAGDNRSIVIWDIRRKQVVKVLKGLVHPINDIAFSPDGAELIVGYANGTVRKTNLISNQTIVNRLAPKTDELGIKSNYSITKIESYTTDSVVFTALLKKKSLIYEGSFDKIQEFNIVWHLTENYLTVDKVKEESEKNKKYIQDLKKGIFHPNTYFLDTTLTRFENDSLGLYIHAVDQHLIACVSETDKVCFLKKMNHSDRVTSVAINPIYNYAATASWDGMIRFWDLKTGELLTVYGAFGNGQFVYVNPDGYYYSSKNALDYIGFKLDNKVYSFEQFDLKYNRPDLVASTLPFYNDDYIAAYYGAYKKRLSKLGLNEDEIDITVELPSLEFEKKLIRGEESDQIELTVKCNDSNSKLDRLHLKINGVPEYGRFGKQLNSKEYSETLLINLNPGTNYFQLSVKNKNGLSSYNQSFKVHSHQKVKKSNLYLMTIGVSAFQQGQYALNYARKDAEDIENFFKRESPYFGKVHTKQLVDENVTKEKVDELKSFVEKANENDVVILFAAGHGVLDANLDYYFAAYDMDFGHPNSRGIPYEMFEEIMDHTKSRRKVMFLDACHSGEIDKDEVVENIVAEENDGELIFRGALRSISNKYDINSFNLSQSLFADMRLNNGSTVVSSAGGAEYAIEGEQWNNGVFTFCLLKGLRDNEADLNHDKIIVLSELQKFIQFEVNKITNGMQTPTSRVENLNNDFRLK